MAQDFDNFPVYDPLIKKGTNKLSDEWTSFIATFVQTLTGYLSQNGIFLPHLTTAQRNSITTPQNGQMIYNTTLGTAQYFKAGAWTSF